MERSWSSFIQLPYSPLTFHKSILMLLSNVVCLSSGRFPKGSPQKFIVHFSDSPITRDAQTILVFTILLVGHLTICRPILRKRSGSTLHLKFRVHISMCYAGDYFIAIWLVSLFWFSGRTKRAVLCLKWIVLISSSLWRNRSDRKVSGQWRREQQ